MSTCIQVSPHISVYLNFNLGVVVSIAWPCLNDSRPFGVVGLDVQLSEIVEFALLQASDTSFMFIIDKKGI
jgi:hypothetical protein